MREGHGGFSSFAPSDHRSLGAKSRSEAEPGVARPLRQRDGLGLQTSLPQRTRPTKKIRNYAASVLLNYALTSPRETPQGFKRLLF